MDELTTLRRAEGAFVSPDLRAPDAVTARVMAEIEGGGPRRRARTSPRPLIRRPLLWALPVTAAVAASALVLTGAVPFPGGDPVPPGTSLAQEGTVNLEARSILLAAAQQARTKPFTAPGAGDYVYTRVKAGWHTVDGGKKDQHSWTTESWLSADGRRPGLRFSTFTTGVPNPPVHEGGRIDPCPGPGVKDQDPRQGASQYNTPDSYCRGPGYIADIPADPAGALDYLRQAKGWNGWALFADYRGEFPETGKVDDYGLVLGNMEQLFTQHLLAPPAWAAVFEGLADLPGGRVVRGVKTATGRAGVAVAFTYPENKQQAELIFDPQTHEMIGYRMVQLPGINEVNPDESGDWYSALEEITVVKAVGLRPNGSRAPRPSRPS